MCGPIGSNFLLTESNVNNDALNIRIDALFLQFISVSVSIFLFQCKTVKRQKNIVKFDREEIKDVIINSIYEHTDLFYNIRQAWITQ
jgi:hypothetical protein